MQIDNSGTIKGTVSPSRKLDVGPSSSVPTNNDSANFLTNEAKYLTLDTQGHMSGILQQSESLSFRPIIPTTLNQTIETNILTIFQKGRAIMVLKSDGRLELTTDDANEAAAMFVKEVYRQAVIATGQVPFAQLAENLRNIKLHAIISDAVQKSAQKNGNDSPVDRGDAQGIAADVIEAITIQLT